MSSDNSAKRISLVVEATQAINRLIKFGTTMEQVGSATGKTDAQLRQVDRVLDKATATIRSSATQMVRLREEMKAMSKETTFLNNANARLDARLLTANKRLTEQKQVIATQGQLIRGLVKDNMGLAASFDKVAASSASANAKMKSAPKIGALGAPLQQTPQGYFPNGAVPLAALAKASNDATKGVRGTTQAVDALGQTVQQNALRYQLYDVAATFGIIGAASLTAGLAVARTGIIWDKNFANVVRTSQVTGEAVEWLKEEFLDLQTIIPVTSEDLAKIGTLGAQMGVAAANLANFTEITAKFSATSGLNVDESATALSRLDELLPDVNGNYERLASTILRTGVNAVATEAQIVRGTSQIASMGQIAGLTTPEVVALSSAMSSLGFSPELQRSVITSSFSRILTATSEVTEKTEKFGAVLNMTGKQFQQAWREDAVGTYRNLLEAIASRGDAVTVLQDLGLASQRLTPNLLKLGQNTGVLDAALKDTRSEWGQNTELTRQYGVIASTVSARIQVLSQTWEAFLVTLDDTDVILGPLIDGLTGVVKWLRAIASNPAAGSIATIATALAAFTGVVALGAAGLAGMAAGYIAITNATKGLALLTGANTVSTSVNTAAVVANAEARAIQSAGMGAQLPLINANSTAMGANAAANSAAGASLLKVSSGVIGALPHILKWAGIIGIAASAVAGLVGLLATAPDAIHDMDKAMNGIDTPEKALVFNAEKIKTATAEWEKAEKAAKAYDEAVKRGRPSEGDLDLDFADSITATKKNMDIGTYKNDIKDEILALESFESQIQAVNIVSKAMGVTQEELLTKIIPELGDVLGEGAAQAAEMADEVAKLESAQGRWAATLGTSDAILSDLIGNVGKAAGGFLDFGSALKDAYETNDDGVRIGGGLDEFVSSMNTQIAEFEAFYGELGTLVQKGGVQLASFFASQGPAAAQALTDSLAMNPDQIAQIEDQMSLAAFYASDAFANTFAQNNSILAEVFKQTGGNHEAVAAFNSALAATMKNGAVDPNVLAELGRKFGVELPIDMIPSLDEEAITNAFALVDSNIALQNATVTPIKIPVTTTVGQGDFTVTQEVDNWIVEMEGHSITLDVDPNTDKGRQIIADWRANEYKVPVELNTRARTTDAKVMMDAFINGYVSKTYWIRFKASLPDLNGIASGSGRPGIATGGLIHNGKVVRDNYPKFATGTIFRGAGTGTSDDIIARVSNGEAITRAKAVRYYGTRMMDDINHMRFPRFANGGFPNGTPNGGQGPAQVINATVVQNYPTTQDPIKTLKQDAESVLAGIWM